MASSANPGGFYYSSEEAAPQFNNTVQMISYMMGLGAFGGSLYYMANDVVSPETGLTRLDRASKSFEVFANRNFSGMLNTFRIPEFLSGFASPRGLGLDIVDGTTSSGKTGRIGQYKFTAKQFSGKETQDYLRHILNPEEFQNLSDRFLNNIDKSNYELVYEQDIDEIAQGRLYLDEYKEELQYKPGLEQTVENQEYVKKLKGRRLVTDRLSLMNLNYQSELLDTLEGVGKTAKINPAFTSILQSIGYLENKDVKVANQLFSGVVNESDYEDVAEKAKYGLIPSPNKSGTKTKLQYLTSYLNFGFNRFNKLLTTTAEQVPGIGEPLSNVANILGVNLRTKPGQFYEQFFELGLKTSKLGMMYMGLQTVDHYRRNFGLAGHLVASAGLAYGAEAIYNSAVHSSMRRYKPGMVGAIAFGIQMLPGFSQGVVEGISTTYANLDIAKSYVGKFTLMSAYRRTLEGFAPGVSEPTIGVAAGIGLAIAAHNQVGLRRLKQHQEKGSFLPESMLERIGLRLHPDDAATMPYTKGEFEASIRFDSLTMAGSTANMESNVQLAKIGAQAENINPVFKDLQKLGLTYQDLPEELRAEYDSIVSKAIPEYHQSITGDSDVDFNPIRNKNVRKRVANFYSDNMDSLISFTNKVREHLLSNGHISSPAQFSSFINANEAKQQIDEFSLVTHEISKAYEYVNYNENNIFNTSLINRLSEIKERYREDSSIIGRASEFLEVQGTKMYHAFMGASMEGETFDKALKEIDMKPFFTKRYGTLIAGGFLLHQLFTGALLGSMKDPDDLRAEYEGEKYIEVKKGRFWEGGGTPYEGKETEYLRPSQYAMMMNRTNEKAVWGDDDERYNPFTKFFLKNFTYYLEEKNYSNRPYPMTSAAFEDVPVIGPLLANTIGKLIKPPKLMHASEYMRENEQGEIEFLYPKEYGSSPELGSLPPGQPKSPYSFSSMIGSMGYQFRELEGLTGFVKNQFQKVLTGQETFGMTEVLFETSKNMDSITNTYWDMDLGGALFLSEPVRRLLPAPRSEVQTYNPITNTMPTWMPDKFKVGDPYTKVKAGHARLPGAGYAAMHKELKDIDPEDYPLVHKYNILSNLAPTSPEIINMREELYKRRAQGITTDYENKIMDSATSNLNKMLAPITDYEPENAIKIPYVSDAVSSVYNTALSAVRKTAQPLEFLIPAGFRPTQKLLGQNRSAIEQYEYERLYATPHAFWNEPWRDWLRPSLLSAANMLGYDGKPSHVKDREEMNSYFDKIQYMKYMNLAMNATNLTDKKRFLGVASRTRFGVNPNGDAMSIYMALPEEERKFFNEFANAKEDERDRIKEMIPEDQVHLYENIWSRLDNGEDLSLYSQGQQKLDEATMMRQYENLKETQLEYDTPAPDWIGWHKEVDVNDIKIKYLDDTGAELRDYDLWASQARRVRRQPYLEESYGFMHGGVTPNRNKLGNLIQQVNRNYGSAIQNFSINTSNDPFAKTMSYLTVNDNRVGEIMSHISSRYEE